MKYLKYFENNNKNQFSFMELTSLKNLKISKNIIGDFYCTGNKLTSLEFGPETISGNFKCSENSLTSLKYGPKKVDGKYDCCHNYLTSLEFIPENISNIGCSYNFLTTLEFSPEICDFVYCSHNYLTSLKGCPKKINGIFSCSHNKLTSLEYCPEYVREMFICNDNNWTNPIPHDLVEKFSFTINDLYTFEQKKKFRSYKFQKQFLTEYPEKYKDLIQIGYHKKIKDEFDWLFNAADMGLM